MPFCSESTGQSRTYLRKKMHITEGIITGGSAIGYTGAGLALAWYGSKKMKQVAAAFPNKRPLLGMAGALIFFVSLIPIPAFTGTCSHPCGTPFIAILFGPAIAIALTGGTLLLQAAFFSHGGFGTWGANVIALGLFGSLGGWGFFWMAKKIGLPLWFAGLAGGLIGNLMVYAGSGLILAGELAGAPDPQYAFTGYLAVIYGAYLPTQVPIAIGEMAITGMALQYIYKQRPEVLADLGLVPPPASRAAKVAGIALLSIFLTLFFWWVSVKPIAAANSPDGNIPKENQMTEETIQPKKTFTGMDEAVNETLAEEAGLTPRSPYIDIESMGDLWNALLLSSGAVCGFIFGRWWHLIGHRDREDYAA